MRNKNYSVYSVHDDLVYCKLALSNYTVYRHLKLICEEEMLYFCYLFAFF